jgi:hypothetical protein
MFFAFDIDVGLVSMKPEKKSSSAGIYSDSVNCNNFSFVSLS